MRKEAEEFHLFQWAVEAQGHPIELTIWGVVMAMVMVPGFDKSPGGSPGDQVSSCPHSGPATPECQQGLLTGALDLSLFSFSNSTFKFIGLQRKLVILLHTVVKFLKILFLFFAALGFELSVLYSLSHSTSYFCCGWL
jgi:hypothetical protein